MTGAEPPEFSVDTGLFRQLGELLVGRDSTALVELVKNSYDADATRVVIRGENLRSPATAVITVADNGTGMTEAQFRSGFLRLAARGKADGDRRSPLYQRRFTGEKGVGRLAAHKLAAFLDVTTIAYTTEDDEPLVLATRIAQPDLAAAELIDRLSGAPRSLVMAQIDWDLIEQVDTLAQVDEGLLLAAGGGLPSAQAGTTLRLERLRHAWSSDDLRDVVRQLNNFEPPRSLVSTLPRGVISKAVLFDTPKVRDADSGDPGITLEFDGEFVNPEELWPNVVKTAEWILEIRARAGGPVEYALSPTKVGLRTNHFAKAVKATKPHPAPSIGPFFDARILLRPGHVPTSESSWAEHNSGIRVYLEGFRILPYGEPRNDWLSLDYNYTKRTGRLQIDPLLAGPEEELNALRELAARDVSLRLFPNRAFFGAVFLTEAETGGLRTLVNREGFVPDETFTRLVEMVTVGLTLTHRSHALASLTLKNFERDETDHETNEPTDDESQEEDGRESSGDHGGSSQPSDSDSDDEGSDLDREWTVLGGPSTHRGSAAELRSAIERLREALGVPTESGTRWEGRSEWSESDIRRILESIRAVEAAAAQATEDLSLLRILASIGSQLAAFTHELALLVPTAVAAERSLAPVPGTRWPSEAVIARRAVTDLRRVLEQQSSYLVDVATTEGRRRRTRQDIADRVESAFLAIRGSATTREVDLVNAVPPGVKTPPLFRAELQAILTNLLSNAIKAAGSPGRVQVLAGSLDSGARIVIQNTGTAVDPKEAETWFMPYASTTTEVDLALGQGMGLGLPITRDIVSEYGGTVSFIEPTSGYATAIEVVIPE